MADLSADLDTLREALTVALTDHTVRTLAAVEAFVTALEALVCETIRIVRTERGGETDDVLI